MPCFSLLFFFFSCFFSLLMRVSLYGYAFLHLMDCTITPRRHAAILPLPPRRLPPSFRPRRFATPLRRRLSFDMFSSDARCCCLYYAIDRTATTIRQHTTIIDTNIMLRLVATTPYCCRDMMIIFCARVLSSRAEMPTLRLLFEMIFRGFDCRARLPRINTRHKRKILYAMLAMPACFVAALISSAFHAFHMRYLFYAPFHAIFTVDAAAATPSCLPCRRCHTLFATAAFPEAADADYFHARRRFLAADAIRC